MSGQSVNAVIGGDWAHPLPSTKYGPPREKPKGLDWSKHQAPAPVVPIGNDYEGEPTTVDDDVAEVRERVRTQVVHEPRFCGCGNEISPRASRCRSCNARALSTQRRTYVTRTSIVDVPTARAEYLEGSTCPEIADRHGWPVVSVRRQLAKAGVPMRDDRAGRTVTKKVYPPELVARVRHLYVDQGMSQVCAAAAAGTTVKVVQNLMKREGIPARQCQSGGGDTLQGLRDRLDELGVTSADVRTWARANGHDAGIRGVVSTTVIDAYEEAHR